MTILETDRLLIRQVELDDAAFIFELLNSEGWLTNIGDRNVHSESDAQNYIRERFLHAYQTLGFGFWLVCNKHNGERMGIAGYAKRPHLEDVDVGYALLPQFYKQGFAYEAAASIVSYGRDVLKFPRITAIVLHNNEASI